MTKNKTLWLTLLLLAFCGCHKDLEVVQLTPNITEAIVKPTTTTASLTFQVTFEGDFLVYVVYSKNNDFSTSTEVVAKKQDNRYVASIVDLLPMTKYYFRQEVRNEFSVFPSNTQSFTTLEEVVEPIVPSGAINGQFSVSESCLVWFSKGNLRYHAHNVKWKFADHQYDVVGSDNQFISESYNGWIDLFGWGAVTIATTDVTDYLDYNEWGQYAISNGGNTVNSGWRTLTKNEWEYLFNTRKASTVNGVSDARYTKAIVSGVEGVILFPDNYKHPTEVVAPKGINEPDIAYDLNNYTDDKWRKMEEKGVVFLPAASYRYGGNMNNNSSSIGRYWSSSSNGNDYAYSLYFDKRRIEPAFSIDRYYGQSVRLVWNVK